MKNANWFWRHLFSHNKMTFGPSRMEEASSDVSSGSNSSNSREIVTAEIRYIEETPIQRSSERNLQRGSLLKGDIPRSFSCGETPVNSVLGSNSRKRRDSANDEDLYKRSFGSQYKSGNGKEPDLSKLLPFVDASVPVVIDDEPTLPAAVADDYDGWNALVDSFYSGVGKTNNKSCALVGGGCRRGKGGFLAERFKMPVLRMLFLSKLDESFFDGTHLTRWILAKQLEHSIDMIGVLGYSSKPLEYPVSSAELQERAIQGDLSVNISLLEGICPRVVSCMASLRYQVLCLERFSFLDHMIHIYSGSLDHPIRQKIDDCI